MSPRARWWLRTGGTAIVWAVVAVAFAISGETAAAIIALGAATVVVVMTGSSVYVFRSGYYRGRASMLADVERRRLVLPVPLDAPEPAPWDAFPAWPDEDAADGGDLHHTRENGT